MIDNLFEWLLLIVRWLHIIFGIMWIGESLFFMWLDSSFVPRSDKKPEEGHVGDLHMVHGGGFYHVQKLLIGPNKVPNKLHWFKWEAGFTWITGMILFALIFYSGEGTFLLDETVSNITFTNALLVSIVSIVVSWIFYDFLWESDWNTSIKAHILTVTYFIGITIFYCSIFSGRAAYYHVAAVIGTWMVGNVFMRIIPRQAEMIEASERGEPVNQAWGVNAKNRSTHNNYFTLGILFIMISNHFPVTYGHDHNALILIIVSLGGAFFRHYVNKKHKEGKIHFRFVAACFVCIFAAIMITKPSNESFEEPAHDHSEDVTEVEKEELNQIIEENDVVIADIQRVTIKGSVRFLGEVPTAKKLSLPPACARKHPRGAYDNTYLVKDKMLQNSFVKITKGVDYKLISAVPSSSVILDQRGCVYEPRIIGARVGQKVDILNSDPIFHNVRTFNKANRNFNDAMPAGKLKITKVFNKPEITVHAKCSVHPWMGAHIGVVDHPYFAVTDKLGQFEIKNLPTGNYTIEVWHEKLGIQTREIEVIEGLNLEFDYQ